MNALRKISNSKLVVILAFAVISLIMLYCNFRTNLLTDDFAYMFDFRYFVSDELSEHRISNMLQIFPSMAAHRIYMNGRVIAHFFVQMFLLLPRWLFKVTNTLFFAIEVFIIYRCNFSLNPDKGGFIKPLIPCFVFCCIWVFQPAFGQVNLWLDGSINYLWSAVISLLFMERYIALYRTGELCRGVAAKLLFILSSFVVGAYCENSGGAMLLFSMGMILYALFAKKQKLSWDVYASFAVAVLGFAFLLTAPAELANKVSTGELSVTVLLSRISNLLNALSSFSPLIISTAILLLLAYFSNIQRSTLFITGLIFLCAMAAGGCLVLGSYIPDRSLFLTVVLLVLDCSILMVSLLQDYRKAIYACILTMLLLTPKQFFYGIIDINMTYYETSLRDDMLITGVNNGEKDISLPILSHSGYSKYSPAYCLLYLSSDPTEYPNCFIAYYYGYDHVYLDLS